MPAKPPEPPGNPFSRPSIWPASSRAGLRITPTPDLTARPAPPPAGPPPRPRRGVITGAAVPGADPLMRRTSPTPAADAPAPEAAADPVPTAAELRQRMAATAAARAPSAASPTVTPSEWTPPVRRRRRNRRIRALLAYGLGAASVVFAVGLVFSVIQRRAEISVAARATPPVEQPAALAPDGDAPLNAVETVDGSLRGSTEEPHVAMARFDAPKAVSRAPTPRRSVARQADPPVITPPGPSTAPSPLDEPEAPILDLPAPQTP